MYIIDRLSFLFMPGTNSHRVDPLNSGHSGDGPVVVFTCNEATVSTVEPMSFASFVWQSSKTCGPRSIAPWSLQAISNEEYIHL